VVAKVIETLSASTGGTYQFLKERFFPNKLNGVEDNSIGSKSNRCAALENLDDSGEIYRASGNAAENMKTSVQNYVGHDYYKNRKSYFEKIFQIRTTNLLDKRQVPNTLMQINRIGVRLVRNREGEYLEGNINTGILQVGIGA
jgi:hypothetical protein